MLVGRVVRARVNVACYQFVACASAAALLVPLALVAPGVTLVRGYSPRVWALFIGSVLGPQLVGHQGLDFALKWLPARTVSAVTLLEPVGASALAALFLGELPGPNAMLGGHFALVGVFATM